MRLPRPSPAVVCVLLLLAEAAVFLSFGHRGESPSRTDNEQTRRTSAERSHAAAGTFFMIRYASTRTAKGVYGFEPGCEVHLVEARPDRGTMLVSDGQQQIEVRPGMVTDDLVLADEARREDQALQAAIATYWERRRVDYEASHRDTYIAHAKSAHEAELARNRGAAIGVAGGPLDQPPLPTTTGTATAAANDTDAFSGALANSNYDKLMNMVRDQKR